MRDDALLAANAAYYRAFEAADAAAMDLVWADGEDAIVIHPGWEVIGGAEAVRESYHRIFAGGERLRIGVQLLHVDQHGEIGRLTLIEHVFAPGERRAVARVACTHLFRKVEGAWKMILHHASPIHMGGGDDVTVGDGEFH